MDKALEVVLNEIENGRTALYITSEYAHIFDRLSEEEGFILNNLISSMVYLQDLGYEIRKGDY